MQSPSRSLADRGRSILEASPASGPRATRALVIAVVATVILYVIPYGHVLGYPLVLLSTIAHEMGHGIAGVLVGGHFQSFVVGADASGSASISGYDGRFARAFVS